MNITRREALKSLVGLSATAAIPSISLADSSNRGKIFKAIDLGLRRVNFIRNKTFNPKNDVLSVFLPFNVSEKFNLTAPEVEQELKRRYHSPQHLLVYTRTYYADSLEDSYGLTVGAIEFSEYGSWDTNWAWSACDTRYWQFYDSHPATASKLNPEDYQV